MSINIGRRITSLNAEETENRIISELSADSNVVNEIDFSETEYISSAGIRVLLRLHRRGIGFKLINVRRDVYSVLEMTGIHNIIDIERGIREAQRPPESTLVAKGGTAYVYHVGDEILKVYYKHNSLGEVRNSLEFAKKAFKWGIPSAIPYEIVRVEDTYGLIYEMIDTKTLFETIHDSEDMLDGVASDYADVIKEVHLTQVPAGEFPDAKSKYAAFIEANPEYYEEDNRIRLAQLFETIPEDTYTLHGDFHGGNIMVTREEMLLVDLDTLVTGNPIFDFGPLYFTYFTFPPETLPEFLGVTYEQISKVWDVVIRRYYGRGEEESIEDINDKCAVIGNMRHIHWLRRRNRKMDESLREEIKRLNEVLRESMTKVKDLNLEK